MVYRLFCKIIYMSFPPPFKSILDIIWDLNKLGRLLSQTGPNIPTLIPIIDVSTSWFYIMPFLF